MSDYKDIITPVIPQVTKVRIYDETIQHVMDNHPEIGRHAELPVVRAAVENTLTSPTHVEESYNNSFVFVDHNSTNAAGDPLRVPVRVVEDTEARMKSFYFASTDKPRNVIWRSGDGEK